MANKKLFSATKLLLLLNFIGIVCSRNLMPFQINKICNAPKDYCLLAYVNDETGRYVDYPGWCVCSKGMKCLFGHVNQQKQWMFTCQALFASNVTTTVDSTKIRSTTAATVKVVVGRAKPIDRSFWSKRQRSQNRQVSQNLVSMNES